MPTLILADARTLARHNLVSLVENRPGFVIVETVASADDARTQILTHRPDVVVIAGSPLDSDICSAAAKVSATEANTRVIYVSDYEDSFDGRVPRPPGISAILTRQNSFEDILSTMMMVLHGGIFMAPFSPRKVLDSVDQAKIHGLSRREHEVLKGISSGRTTKMMARSMELSPKTVETYRNRLMQKLGLRCMAELVQYAVRNNLDLTD